MKGITPVISIVLLLMIVIAIIGLAFAFMTGIFSTVSDDVGQDVKDITSEFERGIRIESVTPYAIYLRNTGSSKISGADLYVYLNDKQIEFTMNDIEEGNVGILTITEPLSDKDKIKVSYGLIGDSIRVELDLEKSLVAYYKFDSNARDDVGGNHGTPVGDVTYVNDADRGMVASFDGYADYIDLGFPDDFDYITGMPGNGNALTVTAWVKANSFAGTNYKGIITNSVSGANNADIRFALMHYDVNSVNSLRIDWGDTTGKDSYRTVDNSFDQLDKWYHIAVTVSSGGEIKLYLDGNQNGIIGTTTRDLPESTKSWRIGTNYGAVDDIEPEYSWNGYIDEVRFYKRVLSPVEIKILASQ